MIELTDEQLKAIENYEASITKQRADAWADAVERYDKSRDKNTAVGKKIAKGELNNLMIARPTLPKAPKFETKTDVDRYIGKLREQAEHGVEKAESVLIHRYIGSARKAWGNDTANELRNLAQSNPSKFIEAVNDGILPAPKFVYNYKDPEEVENIIDDLYEYMEE